MRELVLDGRDALHNAFSLAVESFNDRLDRQFDILYGFGQVGNQPATGKKT